MILTELATASDTFFCSQPLSFSWTSCAWNSTQKTHIMMVYQKRLSSFFYHFSGFLYLPAAGRLSCRCQWPTQAHRRARPCSSPLHCLWKRRVIRLEFRKMSDFHHALACTSCPWREHSDSLVNFVSRTCDDLGLIEDDLLGDAALPLVQFLADAGDDTETGLQSVGCLLTNELTRHKKRNDVIWSVSRSSSTLASAETVTEVIKDNIGQVYLIALSEDVAPLRVSQDHPVHTTVLDHRRAADVLDSNNKHNIIKLF